MGAGQGFIITKLVQSDFENRSAAWASKIDFVIIQFHPPHFPLPLTSLSESAVIKILGNIEAVVKYDTIGLIVVNPG